ncbi:MAG: phospholipase D-like domain-containing protein [candidate division WOR-3 bacterium]
MRALSGALNIIAQAMAQARDIGRRVWKVLESLIRKIRGPKNGEKNEGEKVEATKNGEKNEGEKVEATKNGEKNEGEDIKRFPLYPVYFGRDSVYFFQYFLADAKDSLDIMTYSVTPEAVREVFAKIGQGLRIRMIANRFSNYGEIRRFFEEEKKCNFECRRWSRCHAKMIIKDRKAVLLGSSNLTVGSVSSRGYNFEADVILEENRDISIVFDAVWDNVLDKLSDRLPQGLGNVLLSCNKFGIPERLMKHIETCEKMIIAVPALMIDRKVFGAVRELNEKADIKYYLTWPSRASRENIKILHKIMEDSTKSLKPRGRKICELERKSRNIHAKIYIFDENIALISSVNMSLASWTENFESGVLIEDPEIIKGLIEELDKLPRRYEDNITVDEGGGNGGGGPEDEQPESVSIYFEPEGKKYIPDIDRLFEKYQQDVGSTREESPEGETSRQPEKGGKKKQDKKIQSSEEKSKSPGKSDGIINENNKSNKSKENNKSKQEGNKIETGGGGSESNGERCTNGADEEKPMRRRSRRRYKPSIKLTEGTGKVTVIVGEEHKHPRSIDWIDEFCKSKNKDVIIRFRRKSQNVKRQVRVAKRALLKRLEKAF